MQEKLGYATSGCGQVLVGWLAGYLVQDFEGGCLQLPSLLGKCGASTARLSPEELFSEAREGASGAKCAYQYYLRIKNTEFLDILEAAI